MKATTRSFAGSDTCAWARSSGSRPPDPAEVEALVDVLLEIDRLAPAVGVPLGQLREPLGPHPDVGDLVGEDELDGALENRVTDLPRDVDQLVEDVAREPLEPAVDA